MPIPHIKMKDGDRREISKVFVERVALSFTARDEIDARWMKSAEQYEARPVTRNFPWPNAAGIVIPIIPVETDAIYARLLGAFFAQMPSWVVKARKGEWADFARQMVGFLQWVSDEQIELYPLFKEAFLIAVKYGTVFLYSTWETIVRRVMVLEGDEFIPQTKTLFDGVKVFSIAPWDFIAPVFTTSYIQRLPWCGYKMFNTKGEIKEKKKSGFYIEDEVDMVLDSFTQEQGPRDPHESLVPERREQLAGISRTEDPHGITLYNLWANHDVNNDGIEEAINLIIDPISGAVLRITYHPFKHMMWPFDKLGLIPRDGCIYDIGVPEALEAIQETLTVKERQAIDNNFVQNSQWYTVIQGKGIKPGQAIGPATQIFVRSHDDIKERNVGQGSITSDIAGNAIIRRWGEERVGLSDSFSGDLSAGKKTPATTTIALIQEGNKILDVRIRDWRPNTGSMMTKVVALYHQFRPLGLGFTVLGPKGAVIDESWRIIGDEDVSKRVIIRASASSSVLNRSTDRNEKTQLTQIQQQYIKMLTEIYVQWTQAPTPEFKKFLADAATALHKMMTKIVDTFDLPDDEGLLPKLEGLIDERGTPGTGAAGNIGLQESGAPVEALLGLTRPGGGPPGPANPPNRPVAGLPRLPGATRPIVGATEFSQ